MELTLGELRERAGSKCTNRSKGKSLLALLKQVNDDEGKLYTVKLSRLVKSIIKS